MRAIEQIFEYDRRITEAIAEVIDEETGEVVGLDFSGIEKLQMEKEERIEAFVMAIKERNATVKAIKEEAKSLAERAKHIEFWTEKMQEELQTYLNGDPFKSVKCSVTYRASKGVVVNDESAVLNYFTLNHPEKVKWVDPTVSKTDIKKAIENGECIDGAFIEERTNMILR